MKIPRKITLCAGSACWAKGNQQNLRVLEAFLAEHPGCCAVRLEGCRCQNLCLNGPVTLVDGQRLTNVTPQWLQQWLQQLPDSPQEVAP